MPLYEYRCENCAHVDEHISPMRDRAKDRLCSKCGCVSRLAVTAAQRTPAKWGDTARCCRRA
jgi:putative FmdB family regulatory protein